MRTGQQMCRLTRMCDWRCDKRGWIAAVDQNGSKDTHGQQVFVTFCEHFDWNSFFFFSLFVNKKFFSSKQFSLKCLLCFYWICTNFQFEVCWNSENCESSIGISFRSLLVVDSVVNSVGWLTGEWIEIDSLLPFYIHFWCATCANLFSIHVGLFTFTIILLFFFVVFWFSLSASPICRCCDRWNMQHDEE